MVLAAAQSPTDLLAQQHADLLALALPDALLGRSEKPAEKPSKAGAGGASTAASGGVPPALLQPLALIEALIGSSVLLECVTREMLPGTRSHRALVIRTTIGRKPLFSIEPLNLMS